MPPEQVFVPSAFVAALVWPLWLLSLHLGVALATDNVYDIMSVLAPSKVLRDFVVADTITDGAVSPQLSSFACHRLPALRLPDCLTRPLLAQCQFTTDADGDAHAREAKLQARRHEVEVNWCREVEMPGAHC